MRPDVGNLRTQRCLRVLEPAFPSATKDDFRVVHYAIMGNHIHLLVEAQDRQALSRGMQGLGVRVARGLNRGMQRRGHVLQERFHAHILRTPTEVKRARQYLLQNARKHYGLRGDDWCASQTPVQPPHTYLLRLTC
jgi:REP element-mobilizing transposase RayT